MLVKMLHPWLPAGLEVLDSQKNCFLPSGRSPRGSGPPVETMCGIHAKVFPGDSVGKRICLQCRRPPPTQETQVRSLGWEDPLEKVMATHYSILASGRSPLSTSFFPSPYMFSVVIFFPPCYHLKGSHFPSSGNFQTFGKYSRISLAFATGPALYFHEYTP